MDVTLHIQRILLDAIDQLRERSRKSKGVPFSIHAFVAKVPGAEEPEVMEARYRLYVSSLYLQLAVCSHYAAYIEWWFL